MKTPTTQQVLQYLREHSEEWDDFLPVGEEEELPWDIDLTPGSDPAYH